MPPRRKTRQSKVVVSESGGEENNINTDSPMETVIEVKGNNPTVTVSWEKKNEEEEVTSSNDQMTAKEPMGSVNGKRKSRPDADSSPPKKTKLINNGYFLLVGNLNNSKTFEEVTNALANYFMSQSLLVQDIKLHRSKKHAHVEVASELDLNKALTLNGEMILDKPVKITKAKYKSEDEVEVKTLPADKKALKNAKCLFLKNVPYRATKEDILKIFPNAVAVRFPGGVDSPSKGIAFVEFRNKTNATAARQNKQGVKIQNRVLIVDSVGGKNTPKVINTPEVTEVKGDKDKSTKAAPPPNNTLFVSNLPYNVKERQISKVFPKSIGIKLPQKSKGFAFVEFATVADAEKALKESQNVKIFKRQIRVQFFEMREKPEEANVPSKTLIVMGLSGKTTAETLKKAFEGAVSTRVPVDKKKGVSKRFGFVEFESEEGCKAVKEAMVDCEIDGSKVVLDFAKSRGDGEPRAAKQSLAEDSGDQ